MDGTCKRTSGALKVLVLMQVSLLHRTKFSIVFHCYCHTYPWRQTIFFMVGKIEVPILPTWLALRSGAHLANSPCVVFGHPSCQLSSRCVWAPCLVFTTTPLLGVNSNLVQYLLQTYIQKKNRKDTMEITNITQRFFPWKPKPGKPSYSILFIMLQFLQYKIHIGASGIQKPNLMTWISPKP